MYTLMFSYIQFVCTGILLERSSASRICVFSEFCFLQKLGVHLSVIMNYTRSYRMGVLLQFTQAFITKAFINQLSIT